MHRVCAPLSTLRKRQKKRKIANEKHTRRRKLCETRTSRAARDSDAVKTRRCGLHVYCFVFFLVVARVNKVTTLSRELDFSQRERREFLQVFFEQVFSLFSIFLFPESKKPKERVRCVLSRSIRREHARTCEKNKKNDFPSRRRRRRRETRALSLSLHALSL